MSGQPEIARNGQSGAGLVTTAQEVVSHFAVTEAASDKYAHWFGDPQRQHVVSLVSSHQTAVLYDLGLDDVQQVCKLTAHALADSKRELAESIRNARNWFPVFAFTHLMHYYLEKYQSLPTWQQMSKFFFHDDEGLELIGNETRAQVELIIQDGFSVKDADEALQWRFGNAYYSFLREVYTVVYMRSAGLDIRVHPLADALFRVDAWCADTIISLWVANEDFRQDKGFEPMGRKERACDILETANPPFKYVNIELDKATRFGSVHLPSKAILAQAKTTIERLQQ